jgi:CubicO group peptidase (beta-lactamase class C family)
MSFSPGGGWVLFAGKSSFALNIGEEPFQKLGELVKKQQLRSINFAPNGGWIILSDKNNYFAKDVPEELMTKLEELGPKPEYKAVVFAPNGGWAVLYNKHSVAASANFPEELSTTLKDLQKKGVALKSISFLATSFLPLSQDDQETREEVLWRMNRAEVPGLGIALINNGKLEWARGYGVLRAKADQPVTEHTRFQAGSISQLVTAVAALRLVQQGPLGLDQPLNDKLTSWKVPDNEFTREKQPTLRHLLSHSAGFNVPAVALTPKSAFTLLDVLQGKADTPAVQVEFVAGTKVEPSAGGYLVAQQLLGDVAGKAFPEIAQEQVLAPTGMQESTFEHPLPKDWEAAAAVGHLAEKQPLVQRWHDCRPALAAAGLWTTPADLARLMLALMTAHQGKPDAVLAPVQSKEMFTRQVADMGLGAALAGTGKSLSFSIRGANAGYTCYIVGYPETGEGAVLMTNSDTGDRLIKELVEILRMEYGWPEPSNE